MMCRPKYVDVLSMLFYNMPRTSVKVSVKEGKASKKGGTKVRVT